MTKPFVPPTTLAGLEALREGWHVEAKLARGPDQQGAVPRSFWETYSAFANTEGGWVILGARERPDHTLTLGGVGDAAKVERELWDSLNNRQKVSANLLGRGDVTPATIEGQTVLIIRIPKAGRSDRPVFIDGSWEKGTFVRLHEGDRRADRDVARRMLADSQPDRDSTILNHGSIDDLDGDSVRLYRELFASRRAGHPYLLKQGSEFLGAVGAWRADPVTQAEGPTVGGLLMFGREVAIRRRYPHWHLSYRELPADMSLGVRWIDRVAEDGTWEANIFNFYLRVVPKLFAHVKTRFALGPDLFRVDEGPLHEALREALVNALIHADYEGLTGVRAIRRPTSFEFVNPGLPLVSVEQLWRGGKSAPRNPVLQHLFGLVRLGEREGSGGPAILQAWTREQWQHPELRLDAEHGETTLSLSQESLLPIAAVTELTSRWGKEFKQLDGLARSILVFAHVEGAVSHARVVEVTGAHSRDATLKIQELVRKGFMVARGEAKRKTYAVPAVGGPASSARADPSDAGSLAIGERSGGTDESSLRSGETSAVARLAATRHAHVSLVHAAILEVCEGKFLTFEKIAEAVGRSASAVRNRYLKALVGGGHLELQFPDSPHHPRQAYRSRARGGEADRA